MVVGVGELLAYISGCMTLEPGDAVFTGTPAGVGPLRDGDVVEVEIEGIGVLRNPVRAGSPDAVPEAPTVYRCEHRGPTSRRRA